MLLRMGAQRAVAACSPGVPPAPCLPWSTPELCQRAQTIARQPDTRPGHVSNGGVLAPAKAVPVFQLPYRGRLEHLEQLPSAEELQVLLKEALSAADALAKAKPQVEGMDKLRKRIRCDLMFVEQHYLQPAQSSAVPLERLQGVVNNLRGFEGELMAAQLCPDVVGVLRRLTVSYASMPPRASHLLGHLVTSTNTNGNASNSSLNGSINSPSGRFSVEVDVIAQNGCCWVEVKNQEVFGLESVHWRGDGRQVKGLKQQVSELLAAAAAPTSARRWRPPSLVLFFPTGVHADVKSELRALGVHVAVGADALQSLPPMPLLPSVTNLDVTAMCALVSEVSYAFWSYGASGADNDDGGGYTRDQQRNQHSPDLDVVPERPPSAASEQYGRDVKGILHTWSQRTVHWRDCLAAEQAQPLLPGLVHRLPPTCTLVAASAAVQQFECLMEQFAGPREWQRWRLLKSQVQEYDTGTPLDDGTAVLPSALSEPDATATSVAATTAGGGAVLHSSPDSSPLSPAQPPNTATIAFPTLEAAVSAEDAAVPEPALVKQHAVSERVAPLERLSALQRAVFGLGDALQAVTLTANGNTVRCMEALGVHVEACLHRAVWLTGL